ncbi:hypothetical protein M422DRAFT_774178 [Sphaerobolus stellatus SS14]|nr:hypothetical protein M422DRAFT_239632 [Sphaerobolus stellatus SS14]KIJ56415.1 hypothetical protein M422DRAFT_774178 [Sphaerobolus stellatus SS14]
MTALQTAATPTTQSDPTILKDRSIKASFLKAARPPMRPIRDNDTTVHGNPEPGDPNTIETADDL